MSVDSRPLRIPLKTFYRGTAAHEMGIAFSINSLEFDALFDTGSDFAYLKPPLMDKVRDHFPMGRDNTPPYPLGYRVPLTIRSISLHSQPCVVYNGDENRIPPRIYTGKFSVNFAQTNKMNFATFKPKQSGGLEYKTLLNKVTCMTMPSGTPGFYFSIGGNLEAVLFDTGTPINVVDPPTADKIGIKKYPPVNDFFGNPGYLVPISLPGVVSFVAPAYVSNQYPMNIMNIVSAAQFLDNGIEFTLNEHSASFSNLGEKERKSSSWIIKNIV
jgi:hypothetical protein